VKQYNSKFNPKESFLTPRSSSLAGKLIILGSDRRIAQQGTYEDLKERDGYIKNLSIHPPRNAQTFEGQEVASKTTIQKLPAAANLDLIRETGDIRVYLYYLQHIGWPSCLSLLLTAAGLAFTRAFPQVWLKFWTEADGAHIAKYISVYVVLAVGGTIFLGLAYSLVLVLMVPRAGLRLHKVMLKAVMAAPMSFFAQTDTGVTINRFSQDMGLIDRQLPTTMAQVLLTSFYCTALAALIATGSSVRRVGEKILPIPLSLYT
jgi:ABC-type multidrug transport system fused ATPase/permease subunit